MGREKTDEMNGSEKPSIGGWLKSLVKSDKKPSTGQGAQTGKEAMKSVESAKKQREDALNQ